MDADNFKHALGSQISALRKKKGYTSQESFAEATGLHRTYIGAIERGERNVSIDNLLVIADALDIPLSKIIKKVEGHIKS